MPNIMEDDINPHILLTNFRKCTPAWKMVENTTEGINMTWLIEGEARYTINGQLIDVSAGNLMVLSKGTVRRAITFPDRLMQCYSVDFLLKNNKNQEVSLPFPFLSKPGRHEDIIHLFQELTSSWLDKQPAYMIKCKGLLLQILHRFYGIIIHNTDIFAGDSRITRCIRFIAGHYSEKITAKEMAEMVGLHPTYFGVLFKQIMGVSFNTYLMQTRVKNAENMLITGEYKVFDAAEACGFTDVSHFYKHFKTIKGYPPSHCLPKKY